MNERDLPRHAVKAHTRKVAKPRTQAEPTKLRLAARFVTETLSAIPTPPAAFALALASVLRRFCTDAQCLEVSRELVRIFEVRK